MFPPALRTQSPYWATPAALRFSQSRPGRERGSSQEHVESAREVSDAGAGGMVHFCDRRKAARGT